MICHVLYAYNTRQKNMHSISSVCLSAYILTLTNLEELGQAVKGPHHHMRLSCQKFPSCPGVLLVPFTVFKMRFSNQQTRTHSEFVVLLDPLIKHLWSETTFENMRQAQQSSNDPRVAKLWRKQLLLVSPNRWLSICLFLRLFACVRVLVSPGIVFCFLVFSFLDYLFVC